MESRLKLMWNLGTSLILRRMHRSNEFIHEMRWLNYEKIHMYTNACMNSTHILVHNLGHEP